MRFSHRRHSVPELNTTSTADISFMLLIFFLVTTNMDVDKGITRQLPPANRQEQQASFVAKGTVLTLQVSNDDKLLANGKPVAFGQLRRHTEAFVRKAGKKHLIKVDVSPEASYDAYFQLQNELTGAYKNLRYETSKRLFHKDYDMLSERQREQVRDECPQRIAEQYNVTEAATTATPREGGEP